MTESETMKVDQRLIGKTAENIFLSILNQRGIFATAFDTESLDGIVFDAEAKYFKGPCPSYVQIKCRGSSEDKHNPQGHNPSTIDNIRAFALKRGIAEESLYFVVGFFKNADIRCIRFFAVPFDLLDRFRKGEHGEHQYRFSVKRCEEAIESNERIFEL